jgi:hypothetical protein
VLQLHDLQGNVVATAALSETETKLLSTYNSTEFGVPQSGSSAPKYAWLGASGLSTGLPTSGVITTGASSYVPEIGRALQSEPVASPGAFPDGTGAATVVEATYLEAANAAFKATAVEHEAALEAAARLEAEEKAYTGCRNYETGEKVPDCGNTPQGGAEQEGELIDPALFLTSRQAEVAATAARQGPGALEVLAQSGLIGGFTAFLAERLAEIGKELLQGVAYGLEICYTSIHGSGGVEARCRVYVDYIINPITERPNTVAYGVETCWGKSYKRANKTHWTYPYCSHT